MRSAAKAKLIEGMARRIHNRSRAPDRIRGGRDCPACWETADHAWDYLEEHNLLRGFERPAAKAQAVAEGAGG